MPKEPKGELTPALRNQMAGIEPVVIGEGDIPEVPPEDTQMVTQEIFQQAADLWLQMENGSYIPASERPWTAGNINKREICSRLGVNYQAAISNPGWMNSPAWLSYIDTCRNFTIIASLEGHIAQQRAFDYIKNGLLRQISTHLAMDDLGLLAPWERMHAKDKLTHLVKLSRYLSETKGEIAPAVGGDVNNVEVIINVIERIESPEQRREYIEEIKEEFANRLIEGSGRIVEPVEIEKGGPRSKIVEQIESGPEEF